MALEPWNECRAIRAVRGLLNNSQLQQILPTVIPLFGNQLNNGLRPFESSPASSHLKQYFSSDRSYYRDPPGNLMQKIQKKVMRKKFVRVSTDERIILFYSLKRTFLNLAINFCSFVKIHCPEDLRCSYKNSFYVNLQQFKSLRVLLGQL